MKYEHNFAFGTKLTVERMGREADELGGTREVWSIWLRNSAHSYVDNLRSGVGASMEVEEAAAAALGFLSAYMDAGEDGENSDLFPSWVRDSIDSDEVDILYAELAYDDEGESRW